MEVKLNLKNSDSKLIRFTEDELRTLKFAVEMHRDFHESEAECSQDILSKIRYPQDTEDE